MSISLTFADMVAQPVIDIERKANGRSALHRIIDEYRDNPIIATGEAIAKGWAISKIDGPLPVADVIGVAYAVFDAGSAWYEYFTK